MADEKMTQEPDIYDREDQCRKAIRTVGKAVFMRPSRSFTTANES